MSFLSVDLGVTLAAVIMGFLKEPPRLQCIRSWYKAKKKTQQNRKIQSNTKKTAECSWFAILQPGFCDTAAKKIFIIKYLLINALFRSFFVAGPVGSTFSSAGSEGENAGWTLPGGPLRL